MITSTGRLGCRGRRAAIGAGRWRMGGRRGARRRREPPVPTSGAHEDRPTNESANQRRRASAADRSSLQLPYLVTEANLNGEPRFLPVDGVVAFDYRSALGPTDLSRRLSECTRRAQTARQLLTRASPAVRAARRPRRRRSSGSAVAQPSARRPRGGQNWCPAMLWISSIAASSGQRLAVRAVARHGVERVGDGEDARGERDLLAGEPVGVAGAVVALVVAAGHLLDDRGSSSSATM